MSKIYVSSGTIVGRINGFNHKLFIESAPYLECDGFEFMIFPTFFEKCKSVMGDLERAGLSIPITHADKDIGKYLSCSEEGYRERAICEFNKNCEVAKLLGSKKIVLHLWGDLVSDRFIENNFSCLYELADAANKHSVKLLIENVPCAVKNPYFHLCRAANEYPNIKFVFDSRFSAFHMQHALFLESGWFENGRIDHVHISDYIGPSGDFASLRPIPHLGEGIAELDWLLNKIKNIYDGTYTLESPEMHADFTCIDKINKDLEFIKSRVGKK